MTPVFIFSLPRSGSTLLQRVLASSPKIATVPEPWILLPFIGLSRAGTYADYGHKLARRAIGDFQKNIKGGEEGFNEELRQFVIGLYERASDDDASYFLDKTPRYHIVAPEIMKLFPDAKAIILWRNPLSVIASMIETWGDGRWNLYRYRIDLYHGLPRLIELAQRSHEAVITVRYEDLVGEGSDSWTRICDYLDIGIDSLKRSPPLLEGRMGDPEQDRYDEVSTKPIDKWKRTMRNPLRKLWVRSYVQWLGTERLSVMGYGYDELMGALNEVPTSSTHLASDLVGIGKGLMQPILEHYILRDKVSESRWIDLLAHY